MTHEAANVEADCPADASKYPHMFPSGAYDNVRIRSLNARMKDESPQVLPNLKVVSISRQYFYEHEGKNKFTKDFRKKNIFQK